MGDTDDFLSLCLTFEAFIPFWSRAKFGVELLWFTEVVKRWSCLTLTRGCFLQNDVRESIVKSQHPLKSSNSSVTDGLNNSRAALVSKVPWILRLTSFFTCERYSRHLSVRRVLLSDKWLSSSEPCSTWTTASFILVFSKSNLSKCFSSCNAVSETTSTSLLIWRIKPDNIIILN